MPALPAPSLGYTIICPYMEYKKTEVLAGTCRAINKLNPVVLPTLEALYKLGKCLSHPDNHIQTRTGQQVTIERSLRTVADMTHEMAGELTEPPKYTAYAKILDGGSIWKGKTANASIASREI